MKAGILLLFIGIIATNAVEGSVCSELGRLAGTTAPPIAPPKPAPAKPDHEPAPRRERRLVPIPAPAPDEPSRTIPAKPVSDPKDIQPEDLYSSDPKVAPFWNKMPVGLRRVMVEGLRQERAQFNSDFEKSKAVQQQARELLEANGVIR